MYRIRLRTVNDEYYYYSFLERQDANAVFGKLVDSEYYNNEAIDYMIMLDDISEITRAEYYRDNIEVIAWAYDYDDNLLCKIYCTRLDMFWKAKDIEDCWSDEVKYFIFTDEYEKNLMLVNNVSNFDKIIAFDNWTV